MYAILRRKANGQLECVIPKTRYQRTRGMTPLLAMFRNSARNYRLRPGPRPQVQARGLRRFVPQPRTVCNRLVALRDRKRLNLNLLLSFQYALCPSVRHALAGYAFYPDGTPTSEYAEPLARLARLHPGRVARYKEQGLELGEDLRKRGVGPNPKTVMETSKTILPSAGQHPVAVSTSASVVVQRQVIASIEVDDEDTSGTEDERQPRGRFRELSEDSAGAPWAEIDEEYELRESRKQQKQNVLRQGLSPDPRRTAERLGHNNRR
jgi:hypothetical protein